MPVIQTNALVKKFGKFTALCGVDLTVKQGEVHAFLGPNGAGKSTTIRCMLGILRSTSGSAWCYYLQSGGVVPWRMDGACLCRGISPECG